MKKIALILIVTSVSLFAKAGNWTNYPTAIPTNNSTLLWGNDTTNGKVAISNAFALIPLTVTNINSTGIISGNGSGLTGVNPTNYFTSLVGTAVLDFPSTSAGTSSDLAISVPGTVSANPVSLGIPLTSMLANGGFYPWTSNNVVFVRFVNNSSGPLDPLSGTFRVVVIQY